MKNLVTLVRLHKWRIDESTRKLGELEALANRFRGQIAGIADVLAREAELAGESVESAASYSNFMAVQMGRRRTLEQSIGDLGHEIAEAREQLAAAFRELKSYEITLERKRGHAARARDRREQATLDEIGQILHRARAASPDLSRHQ